MYIYLVDLNHPVMKLQSNKEKYQCTTRIFGFNYSEYAKFLNAGADREHITTAIQYFYTLNRVYSICHEVYNQKETSETLYIFFIIIRLG